jgi:hypothetical protein
VFRGECAEMTNDEIEQNIHLGVIGYNKHKIISLKRHLNKLNSKDSLQPLVDYQIKIIW